jgi:hypothetical protein
MWPARQPPGCPFPVSRLFGGVRATGRLAAYTNADTWYPAWRSDGVMLSPWTDGEISGFCGGSIGNLATTGQAEIIGDDPMELQVSAIGSHFGFPGKYHGRYPCTSFMHDGIWYYGTYCVDETQPERNIDIMGPFVGFRTSADGGRTWVDGQWTAKNPIFGEDPAVRPVRIGSPHAVDFGRELEYSPDGKVYLSAHGAARDDTHGCWITGDAVYLLRGVPGLETINDAAQWEFFAGNDADGGSLWSTSPDDLTPVLRWDGHLGCTTAVWCQPLRRYLMFITDGKGIVTTMDSYILESPDLSGPWRLVATLPDFGPQAYFLNAPSKFLSADGTRFWLCYSANYTNSDLAREVLGQPYREPDPPGSAYAMTLLELELLSRS